MDEFQKWFDVYWHTEECKHLDLVGLMQTAFAAGQAAEREACAARCWEALDRKACPAAWLTISHEAILQIQISAQGHKKAP